MNIGGPGKRNERFGSGPTLRRLRIFRPGLWLVSLRAGTIRIGIRDGRFGSNRFSRCPLGPLRWCGRRSFRRGRRQVRRLKLAKDGQLFVAGHRLLHPGFQLTDQLRIGR